MTDHGRIMGECPIIRKRNGRIEVGIMYLYLDGTIMREWMIRE